MINRHALNHDHANNPEPECQVCQWISDKLEDIDNEDVKRALDRATSNEKEVRHAIALILSMGTAASSMGIDEPESIDDFMTVIALVRLRRLKIGKFPFVEMGE